MKTLFGKVLIIILFTTPLVYANMVWPALYLETGPFSFLPILLGLTIEFFFIRWVFNLSVRDAVGADLGANGVSVLLGIVLLPLGGMAWNLFPASTYNRQLGDGQIDVLVLVGNFVLACLINTAIEGAVYKFFYRYDFRLWSMKFFWLVVANALSVGLTFIIL